MFYGGFGDTHKKAGGDFGLLVEPKTEGRGVPKIMWVRMRRKGPKAFKKVEF